MSRVRLYGSSNAIAFQRVTIAGVDVPIPKTNRPGAAHSIVATLCAIRPGPRVKAGTIDVPNRTLGTQVDASARGTNASAPLASADHRSVYPSSAHSAYHSR